MKVKADKGVVIDGGGYDTISGKVFIGDANKDGKNGVLVGATLPSGENKFEFIH